jgi:hypothetical protein
MTPAVPMGHPQLSLPGAEAADPASEWLHSVHLHAVGFTDASPAVALPSPFVAPSRDQTLVYVATMWEALAGVLQLLQACEPVEVRAVARGHGELVPCATLCACVLACCSRTTEKGIWCSLSPPGSLSLSLSLSLSHALSLPHANTPHLLRFPVNCPAVLSFSAPSFAAYAYWCVTGTAAGDESGSEWRESSLQFFSEGIVQQRLEARWATVGDSVSGTRRPWGSSPLPSGRVGMLVGACVPCLCLPLLLRM